MFLRPWWLLASIPLLLMLLHIGRYYQSEKKWQAICDAHLLPHLLDSHQHKMRWPMIILALVWLSAVIALAGPSFKQQTQTVFRARDALVIVLDMSYNMLATDMKPNRATRANYKVLDILKQRREGQTGLIAFSEYPFVVSPLSDDARTIAAMVPHIHPEIMPVDGHKLSAALDKAAMLMQQAGFAQGNILLVTANTPSAQAQTQAEHLAAKGFNTSVLALGTAQGAPLAYQQQLLKDERGSIRIARTDLSALQQLARNGHGRFARFSHDDRDIAYLLKPMHVQNKPLDQQQNLTHHFDQGVYFIWLIIGLSLVAFRRGWLNALTQD